MSIDEHPSLKPYQERRFPKAFVQQILNDESYEPDNDLFCYGFEGCVDKCDDVECKDCKLYTSIQYTPDITKAMIKSDIKKIRQIL